MLGGASMIKDIFENLNHNSDLWIRIFDMTKNENGVFYHDVKMSWDNIDRYDKIFTVSCIVPDGKHLIIEGTIK